MSNKGKLRAKAFRNKAEAYGVAPELVFLMETNAIWNDIEWLCKEINKGISLETELDLPLDQMIENVLGLQALLRDRRG